MMISPFMCIGPIREFRRTSWNVRNCKENQAVKQEPWHNHKTGEQESYQNPFCNQVFWMVFHCHWRKYLCRKTCGRNRCKEEFYRELGQRYEVLNSCWRNNVEMLRIYLGVAEFCANKCQVTGEVNAIPPSITRCRLGFSLITSLTDMQ